MNLDKTTEKILSTIISKYNGDMQEDIYTFPDELSMPYGELNSACKQLKNNDLIKVIVYSPDQYNPIITKLVHNGLHYFEQKKSIKDKLLDWIKLNILELIAIIISIIALLKP